MGCGGQTLDTSSLSLQLYWADFTEKADGGVSAVSGHSSPSICSPCIKHDLSELHKLLQTMSAALRS